MRRKYQAQLLFLMVVLLPSLLTGCARQPVERPIVDLDTIAARPPPVKPLAPDSRNSFLRLYPSPDKAANREAWREGLEEARLADRRLILEEGYPAALDLPELSWTKSSFVQASVMIHDRFLYDPGFRKFTVHRFVDEMTSKVGKVDSVVLWHAYPNLGIDERNQFDFFRDIPGGLQALRRLVEDFHRKELRVFLSFAPWDRVSRMGKNSEAELLAEMVKRVGADGVHLDSSVAADRRLFDAGKKIGYPFALEPEAGLGDSVEAVLWNPMSWADWREYGSSPGVDRYRWMEPRFLNHVGSRLPRYRMDEFQYAWFNGAGLVVWENIFGNWNSYSPREAEIIRRIGLIYRAFPEFPLSSRWEPHAPTLPVSGVYSSRWNLPNSGTIWTIVNRTSQAVNEPLIEVEYRGQRFYDLWNGEEIHPDEKLISGWKKTTKIKVPLSPHGFGAILEWNEPFTLGSKLHLLLEELKKSKFKDLDQFDARRIPQPQFLLESDRGKKFLKAPDGMVKIPGAKGWRFRVKGISIDSPEFSDVQYPWETRPRREHEALRDIPSFYIDKVPVTNSRFREFLEASDYRPAEPRNFLRDWPNGKMPRELSNKAVTWISMEEARAFCRSLGKRLPHEWEWQLAAQGLDGRPHPWGQRWDPSKVPVASRGKNRRPGPDVGSFPAGASPYGVLDMQGLIWEWTDEYFDSHTRSAVLKGGSFYQLEGARFYFPNTSGVVENASLREQYRLDEHARYLLMDPSIDRAGTIGFRCVADAS